MAQGEYEDSEEKALKGIPYSKILSGLETSIKNVTWIFIIWYIVLRFIYYSLKSRNESWEHSYWAASMAHFMWIIVTTFILLIAISLVVRFWRRSIESSLTALEKAPSD